MQLRNAFSLIIACKYNEVSKFDFYKTLRISLKRLNTEINLIAHDNPKKEGTTTKQ